MPEEHPVRSIRGAVGLTQAAFAKSLRISQAYQSNVETGRESYGRKTVLRIADLYREQMTRLGITVEDLLRGGRDAA